MSTFKLEIVATDKIFFSGDAEFVTLPALDGEMGIMPEHDTMVVAVKAGELRYTVNGTVNDCAVGDGFADILRTVVDLHLLGETFQFGIGVGGIGEYDESIHVVRETVETRFGVLYRLYLGGRTYHPYVVRLGIHGRRCNLGSSHQFVDLLVLHGPVGIVGAAALPLFAQLFEIHETATQSGLITHPPKYAQMTVKNRLIPAVVKPVARRDFRLSPGAMKYPTKNMSTQDMTLAFRIATENLSMNWRHNTGGIAGTAANTKVVAALNR